MNVSTIFSGTRGGILRPSDCGATWVASGSGLDNRTVYCMTFIGGKILAGTNDGVFLSLNDGFNWIDISDGLVLRHVLSFTTDGSYIYASTNGAGIWKRRLSEITEVTESARNNVHEIYPNPVSESFFVKNHDNKPLEVKVYIINGKLLISKLITNESTDVNDLGSGMYFVKIGQEVHKMVRW